jgi:hypothetical protein
LDFFHLFLSLYKQKINVANIDEKSIENDKLWIENN